MELSLLILSILDKVWIWYKILNKIRYEILSNKNNIMIWIIFYYDYNSTILLKIIKYINNWYDLNY